MNERKNIAYKNPFPVTAVANFYNNMQNDMIVETKAIKRMKEIIDKWIADKNDGITVAIQGEYGTGKTQLAIEIQRYIKKYNEKKYHFICLDSPSTTFLEMYKNRFLLELTKEQVLERLEECYYSLIIEDMKKDEIYKKVVQSKVNIKSIELIERFGLAKSKYDLEFEELLTKVTKNAKFVPALLLLLEPSFEKEVWDWFNGSDPSEAMKERGVKFSISNDTFALESIGIFAFLFGQQRHSFVLFIDEMEKIVSNTEKIKKSTFEALKKLTESVKATKSMLILCGLPDYYAALPRDVQQRIAHTINTENITLPEIIEYICNANKKINNEKSYFPFTEKNLENILEFSNGNIRSIIRLLYHSGDWYIENKADIDDKALCQILENAYGTLEVNGVRKDLIQIFISKGWLYEEKKGDENIVIDFWLPSALTKKEFLNNGIEIYLIKNVLTEEDYKMVKKRISNKNNNCKICVVEGFINEQFCKCLSEEGIHVLKYRNIDFSELFVALVSGEKARHENDLKHNDITVLNEKVEQLSRIVNKILYDINEKIISKKEFYNFIKSYIVEPKEEFYVLPDKDISNFYIFIKEITDVIIDYPKNKSEKGDMGVLLLFREFSYILYYLFEKPKKLCLYFDHYDAHEAWNNMNLIVNHFSNNCGSNFNKRTARYRFILEFLSKNYDTKQKTIYFYDNAELVCDSFFDDDFFSYSNSIKQLSRNFCAELLLKSPKIIKKYDVVFASFYNLMFVIEPAIIRRELVDLDLEILREYYDLVRRYFNNYKNCKQSIELESLFRNYEYGLRRTLLNEREY